MGVGTISDTLIIVYWAILSLTRLAGEKIVIFPHEKSRPHVHLLKRVSI